MFKISAFYLKFIFISEVDCPLPACPTDNCDDVDVQCTRTCTNGVYGVDAACDTENEIKTDSCPAHPCGDFEFYNWFTLYLIDQK